MFDIIDSSNKLSFENDLLADGNFTVSVKFKTLAPVFLQLPPTGIVLLKLALSSLHLASASTTKTLCRLGLAPASTKHRNFKASTSTKAGLSEATVHLVTTLGSVNLEYFFGERLITLRMYGHIGKHCPKFGDNRDIRNESMRRESARARTDLCTNAYATNLKIDDKCKSMIVLNIDDKCKSMIVLNIDDKCKSMIVLNIDDKCKSMIVLNIDDKCKSMIVLNIDDKCKSMIVLNIDDKCKSMIVLNIDDKCKSMIVLNIDDKCKSMIVLNIDDKCKSMIVLNIDDKCKSMIVLNIDDKCKSMIVLNIDDKCKSMIVLNIDDKCKSMIVLNIDDKCKSMIVSVATEISERGRKSQACAPPPVTRTNLPMVPPVAVGYVSVLRGAPA
ncbi:hypothetical protein FQA39_LY15627 [Lamprigera yunnana]|nr:hypothetical protein FQA39_LY15627 [Lamprigera yunnana]